MDNKEALSRLRAMILLGDEETRGVLSSDYKRLDFGEKYQEVSSRLKIHEVTSEGNILISYIFDGDYDPRKIVVQQGKVLEIEDYIQMFGQHQLIEMKLWIE